MTEVAPQQDINPRKKLYSALVGNANPEAKSHFKQFSFEQFNKRLDDEKFVEDLYESLRSNDVVLDAKNRQPEQNYYDFIDAYVKVPTAKPAAKPAAPVVAPVAAPIEQAAPIPSVEPMEEEEDIREITLPEVTAYGNLPQPGTQLYEDIMRTNPPVGSDEYNLKIAVQNQIPTPELGAGGYGGALQAPFETKAQIEQEAQSPVFRRQKLAEEMFSGNIPAVTQEDVRKAQRGFGAATKEQQEAAIMGGTGAELAQQREDEKLTKAQIVGEEANKFLSGLNRAIYKTPSAMAKTIGELGVGVINMLGGDMKSEESVLYSLADKYDQWLDTSEVARDWIGDPRYQGLAVDVGSGLGQIATMIAAGPTGASRTLMSRPTVLKSVAQKMFSKPSLIAGAQVFNSEYENMKAKGESDETAFKQALTNWFATAPLENLPIINLAERLNKTVGVQATRRILNAIQQGAEEGGQEALQQLFSNFSNNALVELESNVVDWTEGLQPSANAGGVVGLLIGSLANAKAAKGYSKQQQVTQGPSVLTDFSEDVQNHPFIQEQIDFFRERAESEKGTKRDRRMLNQLQNDPEGAVKEEIKYLQEEIESNKNDGLPTIRDEQKLSDLQDLLGKIQTEKQSPKGVQAEAAVAPPVTPEVAPVSEEAITEETIPVEEDEDLAALNEQIAAIENAPAEGEVVAEEVPVAPLNIDFSKNEGRNVNYQGVQGRIKIDSDGVPYVFTKDGDVVYIEGGLSGQTPQQLGVQPLADDVINEADVETVLQDENAPLDQGQLEYDFDNNSITLYGKPFTYEGVEVNSKGQTTALRLKDANGKTKYVRNEDTILEFEIQKELYEKSRSNKPLTVESASQAAEQLQVSPVTRPEQISQPVQQERPTGNLEGNEIVAEQAPPRAPKAKKEKAPKPAPVTPPAAPKAQPVAEKKEEKPTTGVPEEGSRTELPPQSKYSTTPRKMVFKDGEWKEKVGREVSSVSEAVQEQAQEAFSGKVEAKAEEVLVEPLTEQEKEITKEINISENEAATAKQSSPNRTRKSKSVTEAIEREATDVESSGSAERAEEVIEAIEAAESVILTNAEVDEFFDKKYGFSALKLAEGYNLAGKRADLYDIYESVTGKKLDTEGNSYRPSEKAIQFAQDLLSALGREGIKLKTPLGIDGITINISPSPVKPFSKTGTDALQELVSKDDMRPSMQGVYFDGDNMVATNAFILTVQKKTESDREIIEKAEALLVKYLSKNFAPNDARQIASKTYEEIKKNGLNGKIINLKTGEVIDQKYPDYQNVIPKKNETKTGKMSIQDLINLANGANITLSNNNKEVRPIVFSIKGDEQFEIGLDAKGLKDLLQSLQGSGAESVTLELQSPSKGVLIKGDNGSIGLIMPVMIGEEIKNRSQAIPLETKPAPKAPETKPVSNQEVEATTNALDDAIKKNEIKFVEDEGRVRMTGGGIESKVAAQRGDKKENVTKPSVIPFLPKIINALHLARSSKDKNSILKNGFDEKQASIDSPIPGIYFSSEDWSTMDRFGRAKENGLYVSVKNDGLIYFDDSNSFRNYLKENKLPYEGQTLTQSQLNQLKANGVKGILLREDFASQSRNELIVIDKSIIENISDKEKSITPFPSSFSDSKSIAEAYHKAKKDGTNPELVKAVEELLGAKEITTQTSFTSEQSSEAATAFDKAKTSKGFDKKYGKGAYKALSDITKNFEDIMDKVSEKIKQDCIV